MDRLNPIRRRCFLALAIGLMIFAGCAPELARRPTLDEARSGQRPQEGDSTLRPGEIRAEVAQIDPARREIRVITDDGRRDIVPFDPAYTRVVYHGFDYPATALEAGDIIALTPPPRTSPYVDTIRLQVPVQARAASPSIARSAPPPPRPEVIEGTVERIDYDRGVFDVRPRSGGRMVTVTLPYNARGADVDNFRRLRRGDYVRIEGEFVSPDSAQLMAFLR
ncbi:MAG: hypothetical protein ACREQP_12670 [Candidatus Binatia bacterium]